MKHIFLGISATLAALTFVGCSGSAKAPVLSGPGFVVYTVYGTPGASHPDPGVQISGNVGYPQSCQFGSTGCTISFNATTDSNGSYAFATNDIPDTWSFSRLNDANCSGGSNSINYPGYLVGYSGESVVLNCNFSTVYSAHLTSPTVYVGYQETPPSQVVINSDLNGLFGSSPTTVRSYNTSGSVEAQISAVPAAGGSSISVPFTTTLSSPGYHILAIPSANIPGTYAAVVTLQTIAVAPPRNPGPCSPIHGCPL